MSIRLFVNGKPIAEAVSMEVEIEREEVDVPDFTGPFTIEYEGTLTLSNEAREILLPPKKDDRLTSKLGGFVKSIKINQRAYNRMSKSLDKLEKVKK